jgi:CheY-like chemotaxis protein
MRPALKWLLMASLPLPALALAVTQGDTWPYLLPLLVILCLLGYLLHRRRCEHMLRHATGQLEETVARLTRELEQARDAPGRPARRTQRRLAGLHILLAEDNLLNQQVARDMLAHGGATVTIANNGVEALARLRQQRYDCVLMDIQMPEMDGLEAVRRIRADTATAGLPVIALTANARPEEREQYLALGMNDVIGKPIDLEPLYAALLKWSVRAAVADGGAPAVPADTAVLDMSVLSRLCVDSPERLARYLEVFLVSLRQTIAELQAAVGREEMAAVAMLGHKIKSSACAVGAAELTALAQALEHLGAGGCVAHARALAGRLPGMVERIEAQVALQRGTA